MESWIELVRNASIDYVILPIMDASFLAHQRHLINLSIITDKSMKSLKRSHPYGQSENASTDSDNDANIDSPLLRLPPELRNRIYALVLGVGHIHVRYRPYGSRCEKEAPSISSTSPSASTESKVPIKSKGGYYALALPADADPWGRAFKKRINRKGSSDLETKMLSTAERASTHTSIRSFSAAVDLALLFTCRQIHSETALLPFYLNAWSFESSLVMERCLVRDRRLALSQRRAIRVLVVSDDLPSRSMERYLGGLRVVVWRNESTKTFEKWHLPARPIAVKNSRNELLLYGN